MQRRAALEADTRERIVRATVALHARHGALATSYAMIAKRAQVAPQTVYNHFPALGALLGACTGHVLEQAPPLDAQTFRSGRSPEARLRLLAQAAFARHDFLAPWTRLGWHEAALIPELGALKFLSPTFRVRDKTGEIRHPAVRNDASEPIAIHEGSGQREITAIARPLNHYALTV